MDREVRRRRRVPHGRISPEAEAPVGEDGKVRAEDAGFHGRHLIEDLLGFLGLRLVPELPQDLERLPRLREGVEDRPDGGRAPLDGEERRGREELARAIEKPLAVAMRDDQGGGKTPGLGEAAPRVRSRDVVEGL